MIYESSNGVVIRLNGIFTAKQGLVLTGRIEKLPNNKNEILTDEFAAIMNGQEILGKIITGTEWFATSYQRIGSNVGLFVKLETK
jgi:hypothetical protein